MTNTKPILSLRQWQAAGGQRLLGFAALTLFFLSGCGKQNSASANSGPAGMPAPPVTVAKAVQMPIPIEVNAIGNVQPYRTVAVKSMVDGQLVKVLVEQGQDVRAGQLLFELDKKPFEAVLQQAQGNLDKSIATANNSRAQANRYAALLKEGVIASQVAEEQEAQAKSDAAAVETARAAVQTAKVNLAYTEIHAPIDGRCGAILVNLGNNVKANDVNPLITINQITPIYVQFPVPEAQLQAVRARATKGLQVRALFPNDPNPATGTLTFIDNAVDPTTGTIKLMGTFQNRDRRLWPGAFVNVQLVLGAQQNAIVVPAVAVQSSQQGNYVFVVKPDGTATMQPVPAPRTYRQLAVIAQGVQPGEAVVVDGIYRVIPNAKVDVTKTVPVTAGPQEAVQSAPGAPAQQPAAGASASRQSGGSSKPQQGAAKP